MRNLAHCTGANLGNNRVVPERHVRGYTQLSLRVPVGLVIGPAFSTSLGHSHFADSAPVTSCSL